MKRRILPFEKIIEGSFAGTFDNIPYFNISEGYAVPFAYGIQPCRKWNVLYYSLEFNIPAKVMGTKNPHHISRKYYFDENSKHSAEDVFFAVYDERNKLIERAYGKPGLDFILQYEPAFALRRSRFRSPVSEDNGICQLMGVTFTTNRHGNIITRLEHPFMTYKEYLGTDQPVFTRQIEPLYGSAVKSVQALFPTWLKYHGQDKRNFKPVEHYINRRAFEDWITAVTYRQKHTR